MGGGRRGGKEERRRDGRRTATKEGDKRGNDDPARLREHNDMHATLNSDGGEGGCTTPAHMKLGWPTERGALPDTRSGEGAAPLRRPSARPSSINRFSASWTGTTRLSPQASARLVPLVPRRLAAPPGTTRECETASARSRTTATILTM